MGIHITLSFSSLFSLVSKFCSILILHTNTPSESLSPTSACHVEANLSANFSQASLTSTSFILSPPLAIYLPPPILPTAENFRPHHWLGKMILGWLEWGATTRGYSTLPSPPHPLWALKTCPHTRWQEVILHFVAKPIALGYNHQNHSNSLPLTLLLHKALPTRRWPTRPRPTGSPLSPSPSYRLLPTMLPRTCSTTDEPS